MKVRTVGGVLSRVTTFTIDGVEPRRVWAEVDVRRGLPAFTVVGLGDAAVRESRDRIRSAILNSGFEFPQSRITANLAPAFLRKVGPGFDAALALGVLAASGQVPSAALESVAVYGELSLGGELRDTPGALAVAEGTRSLGLARLVVPLPRAREATLVDGIQVAGVRDLAAAVALLRGEEASWAAADRAVRARTLGEVPAHSGSDLPDLADVRGHRLPLRALEIAAAGGHNLLLEGPPGTGKTMLARRLPGILPRMSRAEAIAVTRVHSIAGLHGEGLVVERPFRAPHHTISAAGLVGGGSPPRPGEATLASGGVLFLDELSEFHRPVLDALRQPLEDGEVTIVRAQRVLRLPSRFMLLAATNPCPCGFAGEGDRCRCADADLRRHVRRLSGPLLDRMDLHVPVGRPGSGELSAPPSTSSAAVRARVLGARERQTARLVGSAARCNAEMDARTTGVHARLGARPALALDRAYASGTLSARGRQRILRVARTIADLAGRRLIELDDVLEAIALRQRHESGLEAAA